MQKASAIFGYAKNSKAVDLREFPKLNQVQSMFRSQRVTLKFVLCQKDKAVYGEVLPYYVRASDAGDHQRRVDSLQTDGRAAPLLQQLRAERF